MHVKFSLWGIGLALLTSSGLAFAQSTNAAPMLPDDTSPLPTLSPPPVTLLPPPATLPPSPAVTNAAPATPPIPANLGSPSDIGPGVVAPASGTTPLPVLSPIAPASPSAETNLQPISPTAPPSIPTDAVQSVPLSAGALFRSNWACQAIPSSESWEKRWNSTDFGTVHVATVAHPLDLPEGVELPWQNDSSGVPEIILTAILHFPKIPATGESSVTDETPGAPLVDQQTVTIKQYVTFYHPPGGSWFASASPYYVLLGTGEGAKVLVPVSAAKGSWNVRMGSEGLIVKHFVEGGLAASRKQIYENFRDEEVRLFLKGKSDVIFYIRPQKS
jgi:hypothetical protein